MKIVLRGFTFTCKHCGGIQLGESEGSLEFAPIFHTELLAKMYIDEWMTEEERTAHPPIVVPMEISITPPPIAV